jgi:superfamily II DNA or RNA helicase
VAQNINNNSSLQAKARMILRPHQKLAVDQINKSLASGNKRPLLAAPCSFGKTLVAAYMLKTAAAAGMRCIFFADRIKLIDQTIKAFEALDIDFGVIQADHWMTDYSKPIQIASVQTVARKGRKPEFDFAIVDECHVLPQSMIDLMGRYDMVPFIGLSATPYSKGLGKYYDDLIVPITSQQLLDQGYLAPVHYYGGASVNTKGMKVKTLSTGGKDFDPTAMAEATESDSKLTGDIVRNWLLRGEEAQTIAFCPSIKHSEGLVTLFRQHGITAEHIDGYTPEARRQELYAGHNSGAFKVLSCSQLLAVGYDSPTTRCLIDCYPTKSKIVYQQRAGRIMRISNGKEYAIYLDHAGNVQRHGFAEAMVPESLDDGEKKFNEQNQVRKEKAESKSSDCPACGKIMIGMRCGGCGYTYAAPKLLESDRSLLGRLEKAKQTAAQASPAYQHQFYAGLLAYAAQKSYKTGWAAFKFKEKFGAWPKFQQLDPGAHISGEVMGYITSKNIAYSRSHKAPVRNNKYFDSWD